MFNRELYYEWFDIFIDQPLIKIITGIRRSGKSTLLKLIQEKLIQRDIKKEDILYINFESMKYYDIRDSRTLYTYVSQWAENKKRIYLFFDEIQLVDKWEEAVNSFMVDYSVDLFITGSNSQLLSSELSTLLTGRYIQLRLYPLSLNEMLEFHRQDITIETATGAIWDYIRRGGFPAIHSFAYDETTSYAIINDIYDSIVLRDVVDRHKIRNIELLNRIMRFVMDNIGNTFSAKTISDYFKSQYRKVDIGTVYNYFEALETSFIIDRVNRYDLQRREILKTQEKYYLADQGILHAVFGYRDRNISGVLENIIYCELKRRGYDVYIGKMRDREIDFVAEKKQDKVYIQVTYKMESEKTIEREFSPLLSISDHYPKYVVSMDDHYHDTVEGIRHIHLVEFITSDKYI